MKSDTGKQAGGRIHYRIQDMPARLRPREEMARLGAGNVGDDVLLAVILRTGTQGINAIELARSLLNRYGSLTALASVSVDELARTKGIGKVKAQMLIAALEMAKRLTEESLPDRHVVRTPQDVADVFKEKVRTLQQEVFWVLLLDSKNRLNRTPVEISRGILDASLVHPREVFRHALDLPSGGVILAHNHPSGDPAPSAEDIRITKQLIDAAAILKVKLLDHVVLGSRTGDGGMSFVSLREAGLAAFE